MIKNKKYFIQQINSSKAYQFTSIYHYTHRGFKKSSINLGIFRNDTQELVGVLQWGCSAQDKIRLDKYVKESISNKEYLELNRFCMANTEERNSESQAISLGIKWIKKNLPHIKLLVSYAGRKEGNYGYIYQATNWEYLGYFISSGFWQLNGVEYHQISLWYKYSHYGNLNLPFVQGICEMYEDVRQIWSKQFIYIQRLDKKLTPAVDILPYPKLSTDYPIQTKIEIYKQNDEYLNKHPFVGPVLNQRFFYEKDGNILTTKYFYIVYDIDGNLEKIYKNLSEININGYRIEGIRQSINNKKKYKKKYFRKFKVNEDYPLQLEIEPICWIDEIPFYTRKDIEQYTNVTRQAVQQSIKNKGKTIGGKIVIWNENA